MTKSFDVWVIKSDDDCHWYLVPVKMLDQFDAWVALAVGSEPPQPVQLINGPLSKVLIYDWEWAT